MPVKRIGASSPELDAAVGRCILDWAKVEFELSMIFAGVLGSTSLDVGLAAFSAIRSFESRLSMVHSAIEAFYTRYNRLSDQPYSDWAMLRKYTIKQSERRNQVAHATSVKADDAEPALEPYFNLALTKTTITVTELRDRAADFHNLAMCLQWFKRQRTMHPPFSYEGHEPVPDLLLRLRTQRDAKQRGQAKKPLPKSPNE
jgi:hypothetical protein